jgi:glycosyltransferase involved in cell wall biosynthesis
LVLRNAFIAKQPVIATNLGSLSETVTDGKTGFLFENEDVSDLAEKIQMFVKNPSLIEEMKPHFPDLVSVEEQMAEMETFYKQLLKQYHG